VLVKNLMLRFIIIVNSPGDDRTNPSNTDTRAGASPHPRIVAYRGECGA